MKYFSMFSGIGGFELGIHHAFNNSEVTRLANVQEVKVVQNSSNASSQYGRYIPTCVGYSEIDKYAIKVYERHFNGHKNYGDATAIDSGQLPDFDLLVGGFPCQAFSIAGKRGGFNDTRGTLFFDVARILKDKRPGHFILENVKGLLSHDSGKTFQTILGVLADLGYGVEWQVLNAKNFGVPQNRERVFIIGHFRGQCERKILPIEASNGLHLEEITSGVSDAQRIYTTAIAKSQKALGGGLGAKTGLYAMRGRDGQQVLEKRKDDITDTITSVTKDNLLSVDMTLRSSSGHKIRDDKLASTLDANYSKGIANQERPGVLDGVRIRRLTPLECERLMGFPDNWTLTDKDNKNVSDTQRYKMCGNGVVSNVVEAVVKRLLANCI